MPEATMTVTPDDIDLSAAGAETGADVESTETTTTETGAETETQGTETTETAGDAETGAADESFRVEFSLKEKADFGRMATALKTTQTKLAETVRELETLKSTGQTKSVETGSDEHPALKGLTPDADGEYLVNGRYYTEDELVERYEDRETVRSLQERLDSKEQTEAQAKIKAEQEAAQRELQDGIVKKVTELREKALPNVPQEKVAKVDRNLLRMLNETLEAKLAEDGAEFSTDLLQQSIADVFEEARDLFGIYGVQQLQDNQTTKTTTPVKPGTPGAEKRPDPLSLPKRIAHKMADEAAAMVDRARGRSG